MTTRLNIDLLRSFVAIAEARVMSRWVGVRGSDAYNRDPLQLALSDPDTPDHQAATSGLERAGRRYRIAYASGSISGLTAVVRSGLLRSFESHVRAKLPTL